jgi:cation diffusion facilitator family transporter
MGAQLHGLPGGHGHSHGGGGHGHSHGKGEKHHNHAEDGHGGHSHDDKSAAKKQQENINVRAAFIHVLGDFFQSLGVFVAAIIIFFRPDWAFIDPICTFLFSILVLFTTFSIIKDVLNVFMEGMPKGIDFLEVQKILLDTPGVVTVHNLRIWAISLDKVAMSAHLAIKRGEDPAVVLKTASTVIRSTFDVFELTIQVEEYRNEMDDCVQCKAI